MARGPTRAYADTSVFGGVVDPPMAAASVAFFRLVWDRRFHLCISSVVEAELASAPDAVRQFSRAVLGQAEVIPVSSEATELQGAYIEAGILSPRRGADALHVALATVGDCEVIVSWNFRHIVHFDKIRLYNAVNALRGHRAIAVHSPEEVIRYGEDDD